MTAASDARRCPASLAGCSCPLAPAVTHVQHRCCRCPGVFLPLQTTGTASYECVREGEIKETCSAVVPAGVHPDRITFLQGDACALPDAATLKGPFTVIHGANLLCRLPEPE